jgi:hypothetical protein
MTILAALIRQLLTDQKHISPSQSFTEDSRGGYIGLRLNFLE